MLFVVILMLLVSSPAQAGCGCDKPPPMPAIVVPDAAYPTMSITFHDPTFKTGQAWAVSFTGTKGTATVSAVVSPRPSFVDDALTPQLVVSVPSVGMGPAGIVLTSNDRLLLTVPKERFTIIGAPVPLQASSSAVYHTGVSAQGVVYISLAGLHKVCSPIHIMGTILDYPLDYTLDNVTITNQYGFSIENMSLADLDHAVVVPQYGAASNTLSYYRHTFADFCEQHRQSKKTVTSDKQWHTDGTPHTDYSVLILAIDGTINKHPPTSGPVSFTLQLDSTPVK